MIKGLVVKNGKLTEVETEVELPDLYKLLKCEIIETHTYMINGTPYLIVCDEEGMYDQDAPITVMSKKTYRPVLVGNLFICRENFQSLTDTDVNRIKLQWRHKAIWSDL